MDQENKATKTEDEFNNLDKTLILFGEVFDRQIRKIYPETSPELSMKQLIRKCLKGETANNPDEELIFKTVKELKDQVKSRL